MSAPLGYAALCELAKDLARPQATLTALSHGADPFGVGTPAHVAHAEWFARLWNEHMPASGHLRRLHYRLVVLSSAAPIAMVGGGIYENTINCWSTLKKAGKWARYLDLIDADLIDDRRNPSPHLHLVGGREPELPTIDVNNPALYAQISPPWIVAPRFPSLPSLILQEPTWRAQVAQLYHGEIWVEKSDVEDICLPLCRRYGWNYCGFVGQVGIKACRDLVERVRRSGRRCRIFYISDFDPQGENMPLAVAQKIEFILAKERLDLDIQVIPLALTKEQCLDLKLPRAPIKELDRGKGKFQERHGEGATELDALEALHPGLLGKLLETEMERYHDDTLDDRVDEAISEAFQQLSAEVDAANENVIPRFDAELRDLREAHRAILDALIPIEKLLEPIQAQTEAWKAQLEGVYQQIAETLEDEAPSLDGLLDELPEPIEAEEHQNPLFDSTRGYLDQIERYKLHQGRPTERRKRPPGVPWSAARRAAAAAAKPKRRRLEDAP